MNIETFKSDVETIKSIAKKYDWIFVSVDNQVGRVSFRDRIQLLRIDIYTTKMTVCILPKGGIPQYRKNQTIEEIEAILFQSLF